MSIFYEILTALSQHTCAYVPKQVLTDLEKAVEYMKVNFSDCELTVSHLASLANMSDTYFRKLFFQKWHETPSRYLEKLRLEYAERLLLAGTHSIAEVAAMTGYHDPKYFSRRVKKRFGCPPSRLYIHE